MQSQYSKKKQQRQRQKHSERSRLSVMGARDRHTLHAMGEARKRDARVVRPDFVSAVLQRWRLGDLVRYSKLLLLLVNRRHYAPPQRALHGAERLLHYRQPSEYYDTLFADYAELPWWETDDETGETRCVALCFRQYYNAAYSAAQAYVARGQRCEEERAHHQRQLRVLFVCALVHDERVRRFVMARHDVHPVMGTAPPCPRRVALFCAAVRAPVNALFNGALALDALHDAAQAQWDEWAMRRGVAQEEEKHTVHMPSCGENTIEQAT